MQILVTGGTGFIGQALLPALIEQGDSVILLSRQSRPFGGRYCAISSLEDLTADTRVDAVINLAGASMAGKRWSKRYKRELVDSRLDTTGALIALIRRLHHPPAVMLSASAVGYYGHQGDEQLNEQAEGTAGFAQSLCAQWEELARQAESFSVRTCLMRLGVVLDSGGGAFSQMSRPFSLGVGNWIGDGKQWFSWVHRQDVVAAVLRLLRDGSLSGPFNLTAPEPVTSRGFCRAMQGQRNTLVTLSMPAPVMRLMVGEMADELLLHGQRVVPAGLLEAGFEFRYSNLDEALTDILGS